MNFYDQSGTKNHMFRHGLTDSRTYRSWVSMKSRCLNPKHTFYSEYGGRGITVCERWMNFDSFFADMGERPHGMSLERIDNDKGYSKENCRWATQKDQCRNRRGNHLVKHNGKVKTVAELSEEHGAAYSLVRHRLARGLSPEQAIARCNYGARMITAFGKTQRTHDWAVELGIPEKTIGARLFWGKDGEDALTIPKQTRRLITVDGETLSMADWAKRLGVNYYMLRGRIHSSGDDVGEVTKIKRELDKSK